MNEGAGILDYTTTIILKNDLAEIRKLEKAVSTFWEENDLPPGSIFDVDLILEEIIVNTISYGFDDKKEHHIIVRFGLRDETLLLRVEDDARPFNPLESADPDIQESIEDRPIGGLGIYLIRNLTDRLDYKRENGKNFRNHGKKF